MSFAGKNIGDVEIGENTLTRMGKVIFDAPTNIAEIARMDDRIFIILTVPDPESDKHFAGTNLWCIDVNGRLIWKAQNLNQNRTDPHNSNAYMYSDLAIFDVSAPKIVCYVNERSSSILMADTGQYYIDPNPIDWSGNYNACYAESNSRIEQQAKQVFIGSIKLRAVSKYVPLFPESKTPAMGTAQPSP